MLNKIKIIIIKYKDLSLMINLNNNKILNIEKNHIIQKNLILRTDIIESPNNGIPYNIKNIKGFDTDNSNNLFNKEYYFSQ